MVHFFACTSVLYVCQGTSRLIFFDRLVGGQSRDARTIWLARVTDPGGSSSHELGAHPKRHINAESNGVEGGSK